MDTDREHGNHLQNPDVGYEREDMSSRGILIFLIAVLMAGIIVHAILAGMFVAMKSVAGRYDEEANPMATPVPLPSSAPPLQNAGPQTVEQFQGVRLQTNDTADMDRFLLQEQRQLNPSQPYRSQDGAIHIPIEDAMKLVVQRGLPVHVATDSQIHVAAQTSTAGQAQPQEGKPE